MNNTKGIFDYDQQFLIGNVKYIAGIDEVGRGPLAGPVVTACVVMPYDEMIDGVFDSKKVTAKNRERLYDEIMNKAISVGISLRDQDRIDEINILNATKECMKESFEKLSVKPDLLLIDAVKFNFSASRYLIGVFKEIIFVHYDLDINNAIKENITEYIDLLKNLCNNVGLDVKEELEGLID